MFMVSINWGSTIFDLVGKLIRKQFAYCDSEQTYWRPDSQKKHWNGFSPMLTMRVNGVSMILSLESKLIAKQFARCYP